MRKLISWSALILFVTLSGCSNDSGVTEGSGSNNPNGFESLLFQTFKHPRCQNCHAFDAGNSTALAHQSRSQNCSSCHTVPNWGAPFKSFSFEGLSSNAVCVAIKNKFGGEIQALRASLLESTVANWAIADGSVPLGGPDLPVAPPGDLNSWESLVDQWVNAGASCN